MSYAFRPSTSYSKGLLPILAALSLALSACGVTTLEPRTPEASPSVPSDLARAVAFRQAFGLRADETWLRMVALDPSAGTDLGLPLLPDEEAIVDVQLSASRDLMGTVNSYAISQPEYAGARLDIDRGGLVIVSFSGRVDMHRAALARLVPSDARMEVLEVRYTRDELLALSRRVARDDWLPTIGAAFVSSGVDTKRNLVRVQISSANPDAERLIVDHYDAQGRMYVESDGIGVALMPRGTLIVVAIDRRGAPVQGITVTCIGDLPDTGTGDVGHSTDANGEWRTELTATGYTCQLWGGGKIVGSGRAVVKAGEVTKVRMTLQAG